VIEKRCARDPTGKVLQHVNDIFRLSQAKGLRCDNPATPDTLATALADAAKSKCDEA
jgi:hypothetical protein